MINVLHIVGKEERGKLLKQDFEEIFVLEKVSTLVYVSKLWGPILEQSGAENMISTLRAFWWLCFRLALVLWSGWLVAVSSCQMLLCIFCCNVFQKEYSLCVRRAILNVCYVAMLHVRSALLSWTKALMETHPEKELIPLGWLQNTSAFTSGIAKHADRSSVGTNYSTWASVD